MGAFPPFGELPPGEGKAPYPTAFDNLPGKRYNESIYPLDEKENVMLRSRTKRYSRTERKEGVLTVLQLVRKRGGITLREIAFWLNMKPSSHLRKIASEMIDDCLVCVEIVPHRPNRDKRLYSLTFTGHVAAKAVIEDVLTRESLDF